MSSAAVVIGALRVKDRSHLKRPWSYREANSKSENLFPLIQMAEIQEGVSNYLNLLLENDSRYIDNPTVNKPVKINADKSF